MKANFREEFKNACVTEKLKKQNRFDVMTIF